MDILHNGTVMPLEIRFIHLPEVSQELNREIEALDRAAFTDEPDPTDFKWASPDCMVLGFWENNLVSQLCLHKREILVGEESVWVAGVGGVATHPAFLRRGFASQVLRASETWMRDDLKVPFGLLICDDDTQPLYALCGWQRIASSLSYTRDDQVRQFETCVMILRLADQHWPAGTIDLCGLPW